MADKQVRIDLVADDKASKKIDDVAGAAGDLEAVDPEVTVTADTDAATRAIADVGTEARQLTAQDREVVIRARMDDVKGELRELQSELKQTGEKADTTARQLDRVDGPGASGGNTRGQAIADLTGPLGEASGAASDFAGVFDGLGDIVADTAAKMGASQATAGRIASAMGGVGVVVAAGAAAWSLWSANQQKAKEKAKEMTAAQKDLNEALRDGNRLAAGQAFEKAYGGALDAAEKLGLSTEQTVEFVSHQNDELTAQLDIIGLATAGMDAHRQVIIEARNDWAAINGELAEGKTRTDIVTAALGPLQTAGDDAARSVTGLKDATTAAKLEAERLEAQWDQVKGKLSDRQALLSLKDQFDAVQAAGIAAFDAAYNHAADAEEKARDYEQAQLDLKQSVADYGAEVLDLPPEATTAIFAEIDSGSLQTAEDTIDWLTRDKDLKVNIRPQLTGSRLDDMLTSGVWRPSSTTNVTVNVPRGFQGDVLATAERAARRSGGLYRRNRR